MGNNQSLVSRAGRLLTNPRVSPALPAVVASFALSFAGCEGKKEPSAKTPDNSKQVEPSRANARALAYGEIAASITPIAEKGLLEAGWSNEEARNIQLGRSLLGSVLKVEDPRRAVLAEILFKPVPDNAEFEGRTDPLTGEVVLRREITHKLIGFMLTAAHEAGHLVRDKTPPLNIIDEVRRECIAYRLEQLDIEGVQAWLERSEFSAETKRVLQAEIDDEKIMTTAVQGRYLTLSAVGDLVIRLSELDQALAKDPAASRQRLQNLVEDAKAFLRDNQVPAEGFPYERARELFPKAQELVAGFSAQVGEKNLSVFSGWCQKWSVVADNGKSSELILKARSK